MPSSEDLLQPGLRGTIRVLGGPGTGKSTLLVEAAAARISAGLPPESVLLLTGLGRLTTATRGALTARLLSARASSAGEVTAVRETPEATVAPNAAASKTRSVAVSARPSQPGRGTAAR